MSMQKKIERKIWVKIIVAFIIVETLWWLLEEYFNIDIF